MLINLPIFLINLPIFFVVFFSKIFYSIGMNQLKISAVCSFRLDFENFQVTILLKLFLSVTDASEKQAIVYSHFKFFLFSSIYRYN
jgi:hypothetical protein